MSVRVARERPGNPLVDLAPCNLATENLIDDCVRQRLADCPHRRHFSLVQWIFQDGRLILTGRVATFYLKQVLQTVLKNITSVQSIVNNVEVVKSKD